MAVTKHFCDEFLVSTSIYTDTESCCDDGSCCHNKAEFVQLNEKFQPSHTAQPPRSAETDLMAIMTWQYIDSECSSDDLTVYSERKPPTSPDTNTFLSLIQAYLL